VFSAQDPSVTGPGLGIVAQQAASPFTPALSMANTSYADPQDGQVVTIPRGWVKLGPLPESPLARTNRMEEYPPWHEPLVFVNPETGEQQWWTLDDAPQGWIMRHPYSLPRNQSPGPDYLDPSSGKIVHVPENWVQLQPPDDPPNPLVDYVYPIGKEPKLYFDPQTGKQRRFAGGEKPPAGWVENVHGLDVSGFVGMAVGQAIGGPQGPGLWQRVPPALQQPARGVNVGVSSVTKLAPPNAPKAGAPPAPVNMSEPVLAAPLGSPKQPSGPLSQTGNSGKEVVDPATGEIWITGADGRSHPKGWTKKANEPATSPGGFQAPVDSQGPRQVPDIPRYLFGQGRVNPTGSMAGDASGLAVVTGSSTIAKPRDEGSKSISEELAEWDKALENGQRDDWVAYFFAKTGRDIWNWLSFGTLDAVEAQKNLGTSEGVIEAAVNALEKTENALTLGIAENGLTGLRQTLIPEDEVKIIWDSEKKHTAAEKATAVAIAVAKLASLGALVAGAVGKNPTLLGETGSESAAVRTGAGGTEGIASTNAPPAQTSVTAPGPRGRSRPGLKAPEQTRGGLNDRSIRDVPVDPNDSPGMHLDREMTDDLNDPPILTHPVTGEPVPAHVDPHTGAIVPNDPMATEGSAPGQPKVSDPGIRDVPVDPKKSPGMWHRYDPEELSDVNDPPILTHPETGEPVPAHVDPHTGAIVPNEPVPGLSGAESSQTSASGGGTERLTGQEPTQKFAPGEAPLPSPDAPTERLTGQEPTQKFAPGEAPLPSPDAPTERLTGQEPTQKLPSLDFPAESESSTGTFGGTQPRPANEVPTQTRPSNEPPRSEASLGSSLNQGQTKDLADDGSFGPRTPAKPGSPTPKGPRLPGEGHRVKLPPAGKGPKLPEPSKPAGPRLRLPETPSSTLKPEDLRPLTPEEQEAWHQAVSQDLKEALDAIERGEEPKIPKLRRLPREVAVPEGRRSKGPAPGELDSPVEPPKRDH
jgi:hypothetical protein